MNKIKITDTNALAEDRFEQLLSESAQINEVVDSSELRERLVRMSQSTPQQTTTRWRQWQWPMPVWGGALATAAALMIVLMLYPGSFQGGVSNQSVAVVNSEQLSTEAVWEEILLLEEEMDFGSF